MKKIAIINDIHGNLSALNVVLKTLGKFDIDLYIFTGDVIGIGPHSKECLDIVRLIKNKIIVRGNHENYVVNGFHNKLAALPVEHHDYQKSTLKDSDITYLSNIPFSEQLLIEDVNIFVTHYARINNLFTPIYKDLSDSDLDNLFNYVDEKYDIIIYGHEHKEDIRKTKTHYYINIGSAGVTSFNIGYTTFGILSIDKSNYNLDEYYIPYDIEEERIALDKFNVPGSEFIKNAFFKK